METTKTNNFRSELQILAMEYKRAIDDDKIFDFSNYEELNFGIEVVSNIKRIIDNRHQLIALAEEGKCYYDYKIQFSMLLFPRKKTILNNIIMALDTYQNLSVSHAINQNGYDMIRISWEIVGKE